jgi:hypothetical protein
MDPSENRKGPKPLHLSLARDTITTLMFFDSPL